MADVKLTKNELRMQQNRLNQLLNYLPTLQLKKAMLQEEVSEARLEIAKWEEAYQKQRHVVDEYCALLADQTGIDIKHVAKIKEINKHYENIAGVEVPYFDGIIFEDFHYQLFDTPAWLDSAIMGLRKLAEDYARAKVAQEKKAALEKELREVSIRVNLFEKILIPRALRNIKKIKLFLGDMQLSAVSQAKAAKSKIEQRKKALYASQLNSKLQAEASHAS